jgi:hypothetical protein
MAGTYFAPMYDPCHGAKIITQNATEGGVVFKGFSRSPWKGAVIGLGILFIRRNPPSNHGLNDSDKMRSSFIIEHLTIFIIVIIAVHDYSIVNKLLSRSGSGFPKYLYIYGM